MTFPKILTLKKGSIPFLFIGLLFLCRLSTPIMGQTPEDISPTPTIQISEETPSLNTIEYAPSANLSEVTPSPNIPPIPVSIDVKIEARAGLRNIDEQTAIRQLLNEYMLKDDPERVRELLTYLEDYYSDDVQINLWFYDAIILNLYLENYKTILDSLIHKTTLRRHFRTLKNRPIAHQDLLTLTLKNYINENKKDIAKKLKVHPTLDADEKAFIMVYVYKMACDFDPTEKNQLTYAKVLETFTEKYPKSDYTIYIKKYLHSDWRVGLHYMLGYTIQSGDIGAMLGQSPVLGIGSDVGYKKWSANWSVHMAPAILGLQTFESRNLTWNQDDSFMFLSLDATIGQPLITHKKWTVTPYVGFASSNLYQMQSINEIPKALDGKFSYKLGVGIDLRKRYRYFDPRFNSQLLSTLRVDLWITNPRFSEDNENFKGNMVFLTVGRRHMTTGLK